MNDPAHPENYHVLITGANSGIGLATAKILVQENYSVIVSCRNEEKVETTLKSLRELKGGGTLRGLPMDLSSLESIRGAAEKLDGPLHAIACNAGVQYVGPTQYSADGVELTFAVNYLSHFLLTNLLLDRFDSLKRIAFTSSALHDPKVKGPFRPARWQAPELLAHPEEGPDPDYKSLGEERYATSKLCMILFCYELHRRMQAAGRDLKINAFNPGLVPGTGLGRHNRGFMKFAWYRIMPLMRPFFKLVRSSEDAGKDLFHLLTQTDESGKYFDVGKPISSSDDSYNPEYASALWRWSEKFTAIGD